MQLGIMPFVLVPILIYTYFWLNPLALCLFLEGLMKYLVEVYLGYKQWRIEYETKKAYRRYLKASRKLAKDSGLDDKLVKLYFETYSEGDRRALMQQKKELFEEKHKDLEEAVREMLLF